MTQLRLFRAMGLAAITSMFSLTLAAQAGDTLAAMQQYLNSQVQLTTTTPDRSDIVNPGTVLELHKDGLMMYAVVSPLPQSNNYKDGKISQGMSGFSKQLMFSMSAQGGGETYQLRRFSAGERCWVTGVTVQKDGVLFKLYSDPYDGIRYYGNLKIPFSNKKEAPSVDAAMQLVSEVLGVVQTDDQGNNAAPAPEPAPAPKPVQAAKPTPIAKPTQMPKPAPAPAYAPLAPPAPMQEIAPPPPPASTPPTIALGQTMDLVIANFGQPLKVAKLGAKVIYYYKDMKVTFVDGQVSDVQ